MGDSPQRLTREELKEYEVRYFSKVLKVLSRLKGDKLIMTRDELAKALEEYPNKLREALLRRHRATFRLEEVIAEARLSRHTPQDDFFLQKRATIANNIRTNPSKYNLYARPSDTAVEEALLASDEYKELMREKEELQGNTPDPIDIGATNILKAKEEKGLADIEVEVLHKTLETYHLLASIMK